MKIIFNNKKELIINYFSVADGQMMIKTDFANQTELENLFKDFLGTKIITYKNDNVIEQYSDYTTFDSITRNIKTDEYTIIMSTDGSDYTSQINSLKSIVNKNIDLLKNVQKSVNEISVSSNGQNEKINGMEKSVTNIESNINSANEQITNIQMALVELYESAASPISK